MNISTETGDTVAGLPVLCQCIDAMSHSNQIMLQRSSFACVFGLSLLRCSSPTGTHRRSRDVIIDSVKEEIIVDKCVIEGW